ncbi:MAG: hypothetical protein R3305_05370, partial [Gammaproteobacteria bacterium]|nr:hypothetical protein [Gammaproteobacteria bacterium]
TQFLIVFTIAAVIFTLAQWWWAERSFEPLNVLAFSILSLLTLLSGWLSRQGESEPTTPSHRADIPIEDKQPGMGALRQRIVNQRQIPVAMEPRAVVADYDRGHDKQPSKRSFHLSDSCTAPGDLPSTQVGG